MSPDSEVLLSSRIGFARKTSLALMGVGTAAIMAAGFIGFTGFPQATASAAPIIEKTRRAPEPSAVDDTVDVETSLGSLDARRGTFVAVAGTESTETVLTTPAKKKTASTIVALSGWKSSKVSWYGPGFYGNTMAGGGTLRRDSMVVAHKTMKFGTKIQFSYHGRKVIAVVRDRGPYVSGREFDLGPGTAKKLKFSGVGTVKWRIVK